MVEVFQTLTLTVEQAYELCSIDSIKGHAEEKISRVGTLLIYRARPGGNGISCRIDQIVARR